MATNGAYGIEGWFPDSRDSWRLDAITLLAVIGESEIEAHSQAVSCLPCGTRHDIATHGLNL